MALKLIEQDHPVLRQIAAPVSDFGSERLGKLAQEMDDVRIGSGGIGLAAPQVGVSERIIIVEVPDDDMVGVVNSPSVPPMALVNPEIVWESDEVIKLPEGCLSLCGMMGNVVRPASIVVEAYDLEGGSVTIHADRWLARVLQHEIDHLDGILYPDRVLDPGELWYVKRVDLNDPVWSHNDEIQRMREERTSGGSDRTGVA